MEFRILGPFEVADGDRTLVIGGGRQRKLLAVLLLHANEVVGSDRLIDRLWGERRPETAAKALHGYVSQLRKMLGNEVLLTRPGGYVLHVAPGELDSERFEQLVEQARDAEPRAAAEVLREALALWRGPALADFAYDDFARADVERLEERRFAALEQRIEADLALGRHADLVAELAALVAREPLRERLRAQLMLALYRSGRQVDALEAYQQARRAFIDDLGLEPSEELQQLQRAILAHDPSLGPAPRTVWPRARHELRRPRVLAALGAILLLGAIGVAAIATLRRSDDAAALGAAPHTVAVLAAGSGELVAEVPLRDSALLRFGAGFLWSISGDGMLVQIDPDTHAVTRSVAARVHPAGLAVGEDAIWVTDADSQTLLRIDGRYLTSRRFELPSDRLRDPGVSGGVAVGAGSVWVVHGDSEVLRLDPRSGQVRRRFAVPGAGDIVFANGAVWVESESWSVTRIDPANDEKSVAVKFRYLRCCLAVGGGFVWLVTRQDQTVWRFEPGGGLEGPLGSAKLRGDVTSLAYGDGALWATTGAAGTVVRIDPTTDVTRTFRVGHSTNGIAASDGTVAVGVSPNPADATAGLSGRVARFPMFMDWVGNTDPAVARGPYQWQLLYATCAKLYNHPDAPAPAGWRVEPEVAAGPPSVSADGRTYSIRIRPGYRFSPPSGEPVRAEAFRHSIERALSPELGPGADAIAYAGDFAGVQDYRAGRTARIAGLSARGDTLTIRLIRPAADLASRLALTYFCAVPPGMPIVRGGLAQPIPSAGPFYVASYLPDDVLVVKRNPNYQGARPQRLDAIVYEFGVKDSESVRRIQRGDADVLEDYSMGPKGPLQSRYGRARDGQPQRFFLPDHLGTVYLAFNTRRALFANRRMRRAVNFALDRRVIAATYGYLPADHYLPPDMPGHSRAHVFPTQGPDLARARALAGGRGGRAVLYTCDVPYCKEWAQLIRRNLARIGIDVTTRHFTDPVARARRKGARADMLFTKMTASWPSSYPDPVTFLANVLETPGSADRIRRAVAGYCNCGTPRDWYDNPELEARLERIGRLGGGRREGAAGALDLELARDAPGAVLATETTSSFFSERVGCQTFQPLYFGVDIAALCLRQDL